MFIRLAGWSAKRQIAILRGMKLAATFLIAICVAIEAAPGATAECVVVAKEGFLSFEGTLTHRIFPGPPNYEDVRKGDMPEPAYVLKLDAPICATGDEFLEPERKFDRVQIFPADAAKAARVRWTDLRRLIGRRIFVEGTSAFGAHTGHHHAPLLLPITRIGIAEDPTTAYGTPMTAVRAFYLALHAGNGDEAASFVIPRKRISGALSAPVLNKFYGNLFEPLELVDVIAVHSNEYRVRYTYVAVGPRQCNGEAIVRTTQLNGSNLIESIRALNGC